MKLRPYILLVALSILSILVYLKQPSYGYFPNQAIGGEPNQKSISPQKDPKADNNNPNKPIPIQDIEKPKDSSNKSNRNYAGRQDEQANRGWSAGDYIAVIVAVVGFLQFIALFFTFFVMRDSEKRQLRAYVFPDRIILENAVGSIPPKLVMIVKNCGQTPALEMTCQSDVIFGAYPPININFSVGPASSPESCGALGPGVVITHDHPLASPMSSEQLAGIRSETVAIYFYGYMSYRDVFKKWHRTNFRVYYTGALDSNRPKLMFTCDKGNEAD
jgi:hypothetical protein